MLHDDHVFSDNLTEEELDKLLSELDKEDSDNATTDIVEPTLEQRLSSAMQPNGHADSKKVVSAQKVASTQESEDWIAKLLEDEDDNKSHDMSYEESNEASIEESIEESIDDEELQELDSELQDMVAEINQNIAHKDSSQTIEIIGDSENETNTLHNANVTEPIQQTSVNDEVSPIDSIPTGTAEAEANFSDEVDLSDIEIIEEADEAKKANLDIDPAQTALYDDNAQENLSQDDLIQDDMVQEDPIQDDLVEDDLIHDNTLENFELCEEFLTAENEQAKSADTLDEAEVTDLQLNTTDGDTQSAKINPSPVNHAGVNQARVNQEAVNKKAVNKKVIKHSTIKKDASQYDVDSFLDSSLLETNDRDSDNEVEEDNNEDNNIEESANVIEPVVQQDKFASEPEFFKASVQSQDTANRIQSRVKDIKEQVRHLQDKFRALTDSSAEMIAETRQLQSICKDDFSVTYEQMHQLRSLIIQTSSELGDIPSMVNIVEEAMESDLYVAETRKL